MSSEKQEEVAPQGKEGSLTIPGVFSAGDYRRPRGCQGDERRPEQSEKKDDKSKSTEP